MMAPILVPGGRPAAAAAYARRFRGRTPACFFGSDGRELKRPGIQGWACLYDKAFALKDMIRAIRPGAFIETLYDGKPKRLLFDHDDSRELGATATGLEFASCIHGLAFRMPLAGNDNAAEIYGAVSRNERACVSIGAEAVEYEMRKLPDGSEYQLISKCSVDEISLVSEGAVPNTYAAIVDLDDEDPDLWIAARSPAFGAAQAAANIGARAQRITDALAKA
jgi:HK97 family phage prohead protease